MDDEYLENKMEMEISGGVQCSAGQINLHNYLTMHTSIYWVFENLLACCKSHKPIFKDINPKWIVWSDVDIDSKIKLASIDEKRFGKVPKNHNNDDINQIVTISSNVIGALAALFYTKYSVKL